MKARLSIALLIIFNFFLQGGLAASQEWLQVPGVIHVQTSFDGAGLYSLEQLVAMAKEKKLEVLIPSDHDLQVMEYGLPPFRNIIKKREEKDSVIKNGPREFLAQIARVNQMQTQVLVIPGVQSSPFYYWSGSPLGKNLSAHDYRKELLLVGMQSPEDYQGLPLLHSKFSTRYTKEVLPRSLIFLACLLLAVYLIIHKGILRFLGWIICLLSIGLLINHHPFSSSSFDPYHGDQGIKPYQELIDYVNERNGLVFWLHPESNYAVNGTQLGPIKLITQHYPDDLIAAKGYTGFEALYGDNFTAIDPGKHWDKILNDYCLGIRDRPVWGISGADFRGSKGEELDKYQTIFLVRYKTTEAILEALSKGRIYAVQKGADNRLSLDQFRIKDNASENSAITGQELDLQGLALVEGRLSASDSGRYPVKVALIRGGKAMASFEGETPLEFHFLDQDQRAGKTYYRLDARGRSVGRLLSNPIFISFGLSQRKEIR
uniref:Polymerase/histidinol phosphatase N-terminal domain-containing protein n=1 Tax=Candidatus Desulfatibia profunda TaxID=2841695 RepID=A0A8J6TNC0_9BACT|nr:hypothetical protein [Candidatus Desulfatibia profunda]